MKISKENAVKIVYEPSQGGGGSGGDGGPITRDANGNPAINIAPPGEMDAGEPQELSEADAALAEAIGKLIENEKDWNKGETSSNLEKEGSTEGNEGDYKDGEATQPSKSDISQKQSENIEKRRRREEEKQGTMKDMFKGGSGSGEVMIERSKSLVNWKRILRRYINSVSKKTNQVYPNRRFAGRGGDFRGIPGRRKQKDAISDMLIVYDTSGSMSPDEIMLIASEISNIMNENNIKDYNIMLWDHEAYRLIEVKGGKSDFKIGDIRSGWNNIDTFFEGLEKYNLNPSLVIFFSDGLWNGMPTSTKYANRGKNFLWAWLYGDYPEKHYDSPTVFGTVDGNGGPNNIPFGKVIPLNFNKFMKDIKK